MKRKKREIFMGRQQKKPLLLRQNMGQSNKLFGFIFYADDNGAPSAICKGDHCLHNPIQGMGRLFEFSGFALVCGKELFNHSGRLYSCAIYCAIVCMKKL